jgi:16S rRNA G1207 methylase RsmC
MTATLSKRLTAISALSLKRYPEAAAHSSLQAWDSADEYLIDACSELPPIEGSVLIVNDAFGALICSLQSLDPISLSDSYISRTAAEENLRRNGLAVDDNAFIDSLSPLPTAPSLVVFKIPKTLSLLEFQLARLSQIVTSATTIIAAAKAQDIHTSTLQLFEKWLGATKTSLAKKKSRLIFCQPDGQPRQIPDPLSRWPVDGSEWQIANYPGIFSRQSLDIGARFFMAHLPTDCSGAIADLGCGNGIIGLMALAQNPQAELLFSDESYLAVASARYNVETNRPGDKIRCRFVVDNCLSRQPEKSLAAVLCNPPFHQQNAITDHIARQMFSDAKRCLQIGGELRIIGNRHLGYYHALKKLFGNCETIASNNKFVILKSIRKR